MKEEKGVAEDCVNFCLADMTASSERLKQVKEVLSVQFHLPEIDLVRNEIGKCYVIGANHACITLTNHLLERYTKLILIAKDSGSFSFTDLDTIEERFAPSIEKYMNKDLSATLNACKSQGILDKTDHKLLDIYRDIFRNGFGHAETPKILRGAKAKFAIGHFADTSELQMKQLVLEKVPFLHGIAIEMVAKANAWPYFMAVENFIRSSIRHYIKDEFDFNIELVKV